MLTSATLAVGGGFEYIRQRLGLEHARESVLPSHFDYESQALLYVPPDLPDPRTPQFTAKAAERIRRLLEITRGRAFVLFTSYAQMNDIYQRLLGEVEFPMLKQGDAPEKRAARGVSPDSKCGAVRDFLVLAGCGRAGRAAELRDHRPPAVRRAQRSGGGRAREGDRRRRRKRVLSVSGAGCGDHAETGLRTADPLAARSRPAGAARQSHPEEAIRPRLRREPAELQEDDRHAGGGRVLRCRTAETATQTYSRSALRIAL